MKAPLKLFELKIRIVELSETVATYQARIAELEEACETLLKHSERWIMRTDARSREAMDHAKEVCFKRKIPTRDGSKMIPPEEILELPSRRRFLLHAPEASLLFHRIRRDAMRGTLSLQQADTIACLRHMKSADQIAGFLGIDLSNVHKILRDLRKRTMVRAANAGEGTRKQTWTLTRRGASLLRKVNERTRAEYERLFALLTPRERRQAAGAFEALARVYLEAFGEKLGPPPADPSASPA